VGIIQWYKRLTVVNKLTVIASIIGSIVAIPTLVTWIFGTRSPGPDVNVSQSVSPSNVSQSVTVNFPRETDRSSEIETACGILRFEKPVPIPQPVNRKFGGKGEDLGAEESATFRFAVSNESNQTVHVTRGELIVDEVTGVRAESNTLMRITSIDHEKDFSALVMKPRVGDCIAISLELVIVSRAKREFRVWFKSQLAGAVSILYLTGRLRLYPEGSNVLVTSEPFEIVIHSDSWQQRPPRSPEPPT